MRSKIRRLRRSAMVTPSVPPTRTPRGMEPAWHEKKGARSGEAGRRARQAAHGQLRWQNGLAPMVVTP